MNEDNHARVGMIVTYIQARYHLEGALPPEEVIKRVKRFLESEEGIRFRGMSCTEVLLFCKRFLECMTELDREEIVGEQPDVAGVRTEALPTLYEYDQGRVMIHVRRRRGKSTR